MRRTRRSRRLSHTQEPSKDILSTPTVAAEEKEIKTLKSEETDNRVLEEVVEKEIVSENTSQQIAENKEVTPFQATNVSGLVAKAKERFGKQEDVQPVISKYRQKELSIPIAKKIVSVEKKEVANPQSVKVDTQKLPNQVKQYYPSPTNQISNTKVLTLTLILGYCTESHHFKRATQEECSITLRRHQRSIIYQFRPEGTTASNTHSHHNIFG